MDIKEQTIGSALVLSLSGRLDGLSAPDLEARVSLIVARGDTKMVLECGGMSYISSAGLRTLLTSARTCQQAGGKLALAAVQPECRSVLETSGFLSMIDCHETSEAALAALP